MFWVLLLTILECIGFILCMAVSLLAAIIGVVCLLTALNLIKYKNKE